MTFFMRLRLWARDAPRAHVTGAAVVVLAVVTLVAAEIPWSRTDQAAPVPVAVGQGAAPGAAGIAPPPDAGASPTGETAEPAGGGAGGAARAGEGGSAGGGTATASPRPTTGVGGAAAGGSGSSGTSSTQGGGAQPEPLTASDVGVTAERIKIGVLIADVGGIEGGGFVLGLRTDIEDVVRAFVDDVNARGGIHGRGIDVVFAGVDPLSASSQRAACLRMVNDEKVFAVLDSASTLGAQQLCYGAEHKVPYFNTGISTVSDSYVARSYPYQVSTSQNGSRQIVNWAHHMGRSGAFEGRTLGILSDACAPAPEIIDQDLIPVLAGYGVEPVDVRLSCDASTAQRQIPGAVFQMQTAGVDLVLPATIFTNVQLFLQAAEVQRWRPTYSASDYYGMTIDLFTQNFPPQQWDGTRGPTSSHSGETRAGRPYPAPLQGCNEVLERAGIEPILDYSADAEALVHCDSVRLFAAAAHAAGPHLTRLGWAEAVQGLGEFPAAFTDRAVFGPGKTEGGDSLAVVEWEAECSCYRQIRPHDQPAYA